MEATVIFLSVFLLYDIFLMIFKKDKLESKYFMDRTHTGICKGVAIFTIVLTHFCNLKTSFTYFSPIAGIGVSMFLICSGYGVNESFIKNGRKKYWINKLIKIYLPYFLILTMCCVTKGFLFSDWIRGGALLKDVVPYCWYLKYLLIWYVAFYLSSFFDKNVKEIILIVLSIVLFFVFGDQLQKEQSISFLLGVLISDYKEKIGFNIKKCFGFAIAFFAVGMVFYIIHFFDVIDKNFVWLMTKSFLALFAIFVLYLMLKWKNSYLKIFNYLGIYSYGIYLIHGSLWWVISETSIKNIAAYVFAVLVSSYVLTVVCNYINKGDKKWKISLK